MLLLIHILGQKRWELKQRNFVKPSRLEVENLKTIVPTSYLNLLKLNRGLDSQSWSYNLSKTRAGNTTGYPLQERLLKWRLWRGWWGRWASRSCGGAAWQLAQCLLRMCIRLETGGKSWEENRKMPVICVFLMSGSITQLTPSSQQMKIPLRYKQPSLTPIQST